MRRFALLFLPLFLLLPGCTQQPSEPPMPEVPPAAVSPAETVSALEPQPSDTKLEIVLPEEHLGALIVTTEFPDASLKSHQIPLLKVYERASVEALEKDYGTSEGGGFLFGIVQLDQAGLEEHLLNDYGGVWVFARRGNVYYAMTHPTDVQFYRSGEASVEDWADWETLSALGHDVCQDIIRRNALEPYRTAVFYQEPFTYKGEHAYANFYPYQTFDGSLAERYTLVLSQPVKQGEGGLWCVERWYDEFGTCYLNFPGNGISSTEHYAALQAECDAGERADLLTPLGAARDFVENSIWFDNEVTEENVVLTDHVDGDYTEANRLMMRTIASLLVPPKDVTDEELLFCAGSFTPQTWGVMGRTFYGSDWWPPLQEALTKAAVGEDQMNRDRSMMRFYLTSYGRYEAFIGGILQQQQAADPATFAEVLAEFDSDQQEALKQAFP